jgi:hypothetical protein
VERPKSWQDCVCEPDGSAEWSVPILFFSSDRGEPIHVHVERDRKTAKFWLGPVRLDFNHGFAQTELRKVETLVVKHEDQLTKAWYEHFKSRD